MRSGVVRIVPTIVHSRRAGGVEVGLYGRNLLDKYFSTAFEQYSTMSLTHRVSREAHRTVGVFAKYAF